MWRVITNSLLPVQRSIFECSGMRHFAFSKRLFLSDAYRCQEAWERRLQSPALQNIKLDDMYQELDSRFQNVGKASAIDIDLFANAVRDESYANDLEELLHKLRLSPNTTDMLHSTSHAVIRYFLSLRKYDELLHILNDRLNYGIFPDDYCCGLLMDAFIKENNYTAAAKVSVLQMLQEDWSHPITSHLALYSCHMYLKNPGSWDDPLDVHEPDDGEEVKVRVKYLRNPYFDDHFDLRDPQLLVGKTLATLGATFPDPVGWTYQLVGWGMYQKWDKAIRTLEQILKGQQKPAVFREGVEMFTDTLNELPQAEASADQLKGKFLHLLKELDSLGLVTDSDLHEAVVNKVKSVVSSKEKEAVEEQCKVYKEWETQKQRLLQEQLDELIRQQRLAKVQLEKEALVKREETLFFFDNQEKWELEIERKKVFYRRRYFGKRKKPRVEDDNYIPPEVKASRS
ncbi:hypothetical protein B7P43_G16833 [Cryptotermes secundus]|uniref:28S ribosomal protein S27, mitochondrial n=1 Tax=Cryptotermes secundus TaxID=105785 RepID=A0A2J7Q5A6_9NEOP|nr:28S ribosomal protein S27, mitochondrial [Cryptotermes secundus]PNF23762.1 hypothetical protein B7P43_G16833 [Cryptotermes secundus]